MRWIVTGGAGYIGAHVVRRLRAARHAVTVFDNLSTGSRRRLPAELGVPLVVGSVTRPDELAALFEEHPADGVIHLAALKSVVRAEVETERYEHHNVGGVRNLLAAMRAAGVPRLIFSSSAAVYGDPGPDPVGEDAEARPVNRYGWTKLTGESLIRAAAAEWNLGFVLLRQFNVIGAGDFAGAADTGETNLVPAAFRATDERRPLPMFGTGAASRDYVDVEDVAEAYLRSVERLVRRPASLTVNLGTGVPHSVEEVAAAVPRATGQPLPTVAAAPRPGDARTVVGGVRLALDQLGWKAEDRLDDVLAAAWRAWQKDRPIG